MQLFEKIDQMIKRPTSLELEDEIVIMLNLMTLNDDEIRGNRDLFLEIIDSLWDAHLEESYRVEDHAEQTCQKFSEWLDIKLHMLGIPSDEIDSTVSTFLVTRSDYM